MPTAPPPATSARNRPHLVRTSRRSLAQPPQPLRTAPPRRPTAHSPPLARTSVTEALSLPRRAARPAIEPQSTDCAPNTHVKPFKVAAPQRIRDPVSRRAEIARETAEATACPYFAHIVRGMPIPRALVTPGDNLPAVDRRWVTMREAAGLRARADHGLDTVVLGRTCCCH
jgi:hypothetical protein